MTRFIQVTEAIDRKKDNEILINSNQNKAFQLKMFIKFPLPYTYLKLLRTGEVNFSQYILYLSLLFLLGIRYTSTTTGFTEHEKREPGNC